MFSELKRNEGLLLAHLLACLYFFHDEQMGGTSVKMPFEEKKKCRSKEARREQIEQVNVDGCQRYE